MAEAAREGGLSETYEAGTVAEAAELLLKIAKSGDAVLVKGSRSARMEQVIQIFES